MDTTKARVFLAAADLGSFSAAADALGYTQSGVTHMMRSLEEETGVTLLVRGNRGVTLTTEGARLAPLFRELAACAERIGQELDLTRGLERGRVSIGTYSSMSLHWLPRVLELFQERYPNIEVELLEGNGLEIVDWLDSGRIDLAYTSLQPHFTFDMIPIMKDPMMAVLPRSHPMANAETFPVECFAGEPFLCYTTSTQPDEDIARVMRAAGIPLKTKFSSNFDQTIVSMVEHNLGVTILPELILEGLQNDVAAVPISPPTSRTLGIALRSEKDASPAMRRLIACTREALGMTLDAGALQIGPEAVK